jgi:hypothetical protein
MAGFLRQLFDSTQGGSFIGISYTMAALLVFVWGFGIFTLVKDFSDRAHRPVYISPNIIPTFKYDPDTKRLMSYVQPFMAIAAGFVILAVWALFANT